MQAIPRSIAAPADSFVWSIQYFYGHSSFSSESEKITKECTLCTGYLPLRGLFSNIVVRMTDRSDMTLAVYRGRETINPSSICVTLAPMTSQKWRPRWPPWLQDCRHDVVGRHTLSQWTLIMAMCKAFQTSTTCEQEHNKNRDTVV